jgi:hypothetical protein
MEEIVLSNYQKEMLAAIMTLCTPAISPEFKEKLIIIGTAGEFDTEEAEKWFYSVPCEKFDYSTVLDSNIKEHKYE